MARRKASSVPFKGIAVMRHGRTVSLISTAQALAGDFNKTVVADMQKKGVIAK